MSLEYRAIHDRDPLVSHRFEALRSQLGMFAARMIEDALLAEAERQRVDGLPSTWDHRADEYEAAGRPDIAAGCRDKAAFLRMYPDLNAESAIVQAVHDALAERGVAA